MATWLKGLTEPKPEEDNSGPAGGNKFPAIKDLYRKGHHSSYIVQNPFLNDYVMVHGYDNYEMCCLAIDMQAFPHGSRNKMARNLNDIIQ